MNEWMAVRLGDCGTLRNGVNFNQTQEGLGLPVLKVKDFGDLVRMPTGPLDELDPNRISVPRNQLLEEGDIVIIRSNGNGDLVGRSVLVPALERPMTFSGFCIRFRPERSIFCPEFAAYLIRSGVCRDHFVSRGTGTGIQNLNQETIASAEVRLPPRDEQHRIARTIGLLDDKIELNRKMNRTLEEMARALFRSWFVDFDPVQARRDGRPPFAMDAATAALFPDHFVDSALGPIPKGWSAGRIGDLVTLSRKTVEPGALLQEQFEHYSIPAFDDGQWPIIEAGSEIKSNKFVLPETCILISKLNPDTPRIWWPNEAGPLKRVCSTEFMVAMPREGISREYIYALLRSDETLTEMASMVTGTSNSHQRVKPGDFESIKVAKPTGYAVMDAFTDRASEWLALARSNRLESRTLAALRDALLPKLLSGEIRLRDAERAVEAAL